MSQRSGAMERTPNLERARPTTKYVGGNHNTSSFSPDRLRNNDGKTCVRVGRPPRRSEPRETPNDIAGRRITRMNKNIYLRFLLRRNSWKSTRKNCRAGGECLRNRRRWNEWWTTWEKCTTNARNHGNTECVRRMPILWALQSSVCGVGRAPARA